jgi:hypothetical protein
MIYGIVHSPAWPVDFLSAQQESLPFLRKACYCSGGLLSLRRLVFAQKGLLFLRRACYCLEGLAISRRGAICSQTPTDPKLKLDTYPQPFPCSTKQPGTPHDKTMIAPNTRTRPLPRSIITPERLLADPSHNYRIIHPFYHSSQQFGRDTQV